MRVARFLSCCISGPVVVFLGDKMGKQVSWAYIHNWRVWCLDDEQGNELARLTGGGRDLLGMPVGDAIKEFGAVAMWCAITSLL